MHRRRFTAVYGVLALLLAGSAYGSFRGLSARAAPGHHEAPATCRAPSVGGDPVLTAVTFVHTAVERTNPGAGFALATPGLRGQTTCADWVHGRLPVKAYRQIDWKHAEYRVETRSAGHIVYQLLLSSKLQTQPKVFQLELRQIGAGWRVGFWTGSDTAA